MRYRDQGSFIPKLIELLGKESEYAPHRPIPGAAASALGMIGPEARSAIPALLESMHGVWAFTEEDSALVSDLRLIRCAEAVPQIEEAWKKSTPPQRDVLSLVLWRLIKSPRYVDAIADSRRMDEYPGRNRELPLALLGEIGPAAATATPAIIPALHSDDGQRRRIAVETLGRIGAGATEAIPGTACAALFRWRRNRRCREGLEKDRRQLPPISFDAERTHQLIQTLHELPHERRMASQWCEVIDLVGMLGRRGDPAVGFLMRTMQTHGEHDVGLAAAQALWRIRRSKSWFNYLRQSLYSIARKRASSGLMEAGRDAEFALPDLMKADCIEAAVAIAPDKRMLTSLLIDSLDREDAKWRQQAEQLLLEMMLEEQDLWRFAIVDPFKS